jgi:hypothetical protein
MMIAVSMSFFNVNQADEVPSQSFGQKTWMVGTSPAMTKHVCDQNVFGASHSFRATLTPTCAP